MFAMDFEIRLRIACGCWLFTPVLCLLEMVLQKFPGPSGITGD